MSTMATGIRRNSTILASVLLWIASTVQPGVRSAAAQERARVDERTAQSRETDAEPQRPEFLPADVPYPNLPRWDTWRGSGAPWYNAAYPYRYRYAWGGPNDDYGYGYEDPYERGYRDGYRDGRRAEQFERSYELGRRSYQEAMGDGIETFRKGDYGAAARSFLMATELHQGDPASRLHAVHALVAQGRYERAAEILRQALEREPKIVYLPADIRRDYGHAQDFNEHYERLATAVRADEENSELWLLLGYYQFFSDRAGEALASLSHARELTPNDRVIERFFDASHASVPRERAERAPAERGR